MRSHHKLAIRTRAFAHHSLDVRNVAMIPELVHFGSDELDHFVEQVALIHFTLPAKVDQLSVDAVSRRAPAIQLR